jgi:GNAT superfamily N-acetyltransferase
MAEIKTRIASPEDSPALARLNATFNESRLPAEHYATRLADPNRVDTPILAEMDGAVVGFANLRILRPVFYEETYAELTELFVVETARRRGIGRLLLVHAESLATEAGAEEMIILTDFYNHAALELYRAMGYQHHDIGLGKKLEKPTPHGQ